MKIKNSDDLVILRQDMVDAIQDLDYFSLGYFIEVIKHTEKDREIEFGIERILHLCHTGKDMCDEMLSEYSDLFK